MKRSTATVAAATSRCFAPKTIGTSNPPGAGPLNRRWARHRTASLPTTMGGCQERMRRATTDSGAAGRTSDRRAGRAAAERRSRAGVDEDLVVAPSGGEAVEKERHRVRPRGRGVPSSRRIPSLWPVSHDLGHWQTPMGHHGRVNTKSALGAPGARPPPTGIARYCFPSTAYVTGYPCTGDGSLVW